MTERLRFGLVGCGVIGPVHAEAISRLPDAVLVSVADLIPERAQTLAVRYGATPYTDLSTMLEREGLDVVIICTPLVDGYAGRRPVEIILGIYESARTRQEVTLL